MISEKLVSLSELPKSNFKKEKDLCDYIERHAHKICPDMFGVELLSMEREYPVKSQLCLNPRPSRIDFVFQTEKGAILIEVKNPFQNAENVSAVGQILCYSYELSKQFDVYKSVILTTKYNPMVGGAIKHHGLGIDYFYFNEDCYAEPINASTKR